MDIIELHAWNNMLNHSLAVIGWKPFFLIQVFFTEFDRSSFNYEENQDVNILLSVCSVQLQKQGQPDIWAPHSGSHPSQDDEHWAAHSEGGKGYPVWLCLSIQIIRNIKLIPSRDSVALQLLQI